MKTIDIEEIGQIYLDSRVFQTRRAITHFDDWGDNATIGVYLKIPAIMKAKVQDYRYGIFLGKHSIGYVVMIKDIEERVIGGEVFDTIQEMKTQWWLD